MKENATLKNYVQGREDFIPKKNTTIYKRHLVIGDVHAAYDKLMSLWNKVCVTEEDRVIFLGDYLYGMGSSQENMDTLHWLLEHKKQKNIIFLRGNVDDTYLHCLFDKNGNFSNKLNSRVALGIKRETSKKPYFAQEIYNFLKNLSLCHYMTVGEKRYFFCHAGIKVGESFQKQPKDYLLNHPHLKDFYKNYSGDTVIVVGHKSPKKIHSKIPELFIKGVKKSDLEKPTKVLHKNILMLDTNAKEEGPLTCVDIISGQFWQN